MLKRSRYIPDGKTKLAIFKSPIIVQPCVSARMYILVRKYVASLIVTII